MKVFFPLVLLALLLLGSVPASGEPIMVFNTGVNSSGELLAEGSVDPHYSLLSSADSRFPGSDAYVVPSSGYPVPSRWFANGPDSSWLAPTISMAASGDPDALSDGLYVYRTTFNLKSLNPSTAVLNGFWSTDNAGLDILINGVSTGYTTSISQFEIGLVPFTITSDFKHGLNTLDFILQNGAPGYWEGSPTGLRVEISGTATAVPEPSTLALLCIGILGLISYRWHRESDR